MQIRISCVKTIAELKSCIALGADEVGFVSGVPSGPGQVSIEGANELIRATPSAMRHYVLTADLSVQGLVRIVSETGCTGLQLVRTLDHSAYRELREALPQISLNQVVHVGEGGELQACHMLGDLGIDAITLDTLRQGNVPQYGGTGLVHDWGTSAEIVASSPIPVYLAGGLNAGNVIRSATVVRPFGIDVCSGVRDANDCLVPDKLRELIKSARSLHPRSHHEAP